MISNMKNYFFIIASIFIISCNSDVDTNNVLVPTKVENNVITSTSSITDSIDQMFYDYTISDEYINYNSASMAYFSKLNLNNDNIASFTNSSNVLAWIQSNLHLTNFSTYSEAELEWDNLVNLNDEALLSSSEINHFVLSHPVSVVLPYYKKWILNSNSGSGENPCLDEYNECNDLAESHYFANLRHYLQSTTGKDRAEILTVVAQHYRSMLHSCNHDLDKCLGLVD